MINNSIKYFREGLGITQKEFSSGVMSTSYFNRFESGSNNISAHILLELLKKNNISIQEFFIQMNDENDHNFVTWYKVFHHAYYKNDIDKIKDTLNNIPPKNHFNLIGHLLLEQILGETTDTIQKDKLKRYLIDINRWSEYHILLFILSTIFLNADELIFLFGTFAKKLQDIHIYSRHSKDISLAILNIIGTCLIQKKINEAEYFLNLLPQILTDSSFLLEKTIYDFYTHFILVIKNIDKELNLSICCKLIKLFKRYDISLLVKKLENLLILYNYVEFQEVKL